MPKNEEFLKELAILVFGMNIQQLAEEITRIVNEEEIKCLSTYSASL